MVELLKGAPVSQKIQTEIKEILSGWATSSALPKLVVVLVGDDPASQVYVGHKQKMCEKLGILTEVIRLPGLSSEASVEQTLKKLNNDNSVDGILLQLPLPQHLEARKLIEIISPDKDADCLTEKNLGKLLTQTALVQPCTPSGIIEILNYYNLSVAGKNVAVVGRSLIVGMPLFHLLNQQNATVTVFHSKSANLKQQIKNYDVVFVAIGKPHFFSAADFSKDTVVIDVGIHRLEAGLTGDVDFSKSEGQLKAYTPVPGGVGPMTIAMLMKNTLALAKKRRAI